MNNVKYNLEGVHPEAVARFGAIETPIGTYTLPAASPAVRTKTDARAVVSNFREGMHLSVITPYASDRKAIWPELQSILRPENTPNAVHVQRPLVIPDPETEALNFNCNARGNFLALGKPGKAVLRLLNTGLSDKGETTTEVHATWRAVAKETTLDPIEQWNAQNLAAVGSDVNLVPTPIVRDNIATVHEAMKVGKSLLSVALQLHPEFPMRGIHFLIHGELFKADERAHAARMAFLNEVRTWHANSATQGLVLSIKLHDNAGVLHDPVTGSSSRRAFSEFLTGVQEAMAMAGGLVVVHNMGNYTLGALDSGADICTFRVSGHAKIDVPMRAPKGKKGPRPTPPLMMARSLTAVSAVELQAMLEKDGTYPLPTFMHEAKDYTTFSYTEKLLWAARVNCGVMVDVADYYRNAGKDEEQQLKDALLSQVNDSGLIQQLKDLCPSLGG